MKTEWKNKFWTIFTLFTISRAVVVVAVATVVVFTVTAPAGPSYAAFVVVVVSKQLSPHEPDPSNSDDRCIWSRLALLTNSRYVVDAD